MIGTTIATAALLAAAAPGCLGGLCDAAALRPFFDKLAAGTRGSGRRPLHILQIGDSHTAGDAITGAWRDLLQARFGSGGRGVLPPGRPYNGYLTRGVTASMSPGWRIASTFGAGSASPRPPLGLSGFTLSTDVPGAAITLTADNGAQAFNRFTLCAESGAGQGALAVRWGAGEERMGLGSFSGRPQCMTWTADTPQSSVTVTAQDGPVTITSWATFRDGGGGVVLSNLGVVGSQLVHFGRTDDDTVAEELRAYRPDLLVLEFGTNEGFAPVVRAAEYEIVLRSQIARLRRLSGGVPILLVGAPDASSRRPELRANAPGAPSVPCLEPVRVPVTPPPLVTTPPSASDPGTAVAPVPASGDRLADVMAGLRDEARPPVPVLRSPPPRASAPVATTVTWRAGDRPLFPPAGLAAIRDVQRRVAHQLGLAFWDWEARMGGRCSAVRLVRAAPPAMRGDYVHWTGAGGRDLAAKLEDDVLAGLRVVEGR